ncbi:MAG: hypothetical protein IJS72_00555 [Oscillospiraceae bacterium]|nr:hypothetical protein [Oscillospiraceae bacterium]
MELSKYDGKCVRIITRWSETVEGICSYDSEEYAEHEFGRCEEALEIERFLFYISDIADIESLEGHTGPYGRFSAPFGRLEELIVEEGSDAVEDTLFSAEPEHSLRLLCCLEAKPDLAGFDCAELASILKKAAEYSECAEVRERSKALARAIS